MASPINESETTTHVEPTAPTPVVAPPATAPVVPNGPRNYLVMMLLAVFATPTGLARAYRGEHSGWTRFWIFVGVYAATLLLGWVPFLNVLFFLALLGLYVWGAVDVFQLYKTRTDSEGEPLTTTPRDEKFARAFYIVFLVGLILSGIGLLLLVVFGTIAASIFMNAVNSPQGNGNFGGDSSEYLRDLESFTR